MEAKHMQTPWEIDSAGEIRTVQPAFEGATAGTLIAKLPRNFEARTRNAEFIVNACNAHDQLVAENEQLRMELAGAKFAAKSHLATVEQFSAARAQLVAAAKAAEAGLARQKWLDTGDDPEAVALRQLRAALAAAGAAPAQSPTEEA